MRSSSREPGDLAVANPGELLRELGELATSLCPALRPAGSDDVLRSLMETARRLFGAAACSLALLSDDDSELVYTAAAGEGANTVRGMRLRDGQRVDDQRADSPDHLQPETDRRLMDFFALVLAAISLGALVTPILLHAGLHLTMLVYGAGIPVLCLLALPRLVKADRIASIQATAIAPRVAILERLDLFRSASRSSLESLAEAAAQITVPADTVVVREGDQSDAFYVVVSGQLAVSAAGETHARPVQLRTLGPDSYFGEIGLLGQMARTATVTTTSECSLLRIQGHDFLDALTSLNASSSLVQGAQSRLAITHPSSRALQPLLQPDQEADATVTSLGG